GIRRMRPCEWNAHATDDGDAPHCCADEHWTSSGLAPPDAQEGAPTRLRYHCSAHRGPRPCRTGSAGFTAHRDWQVPVRRRYSVRPDLHQPKDVPPWAITPLSWPATATSSRPISPP